jgi:tripartite-type tricarboxylate transporter receptor subunit TctC
MGVVMSGAMAADYPDKPIKLVVPYPAGAPDAYGRLLADKISKTLGQTVIVENKPGAGGGLGAQNVARSRADGYTLLFAGSSLFVINPTLYKNPIYKRDQFQAIAFASEVPMVFLARKDFPANSMAELIAYMKKEPGKVKFGNPSVGSTFHLLWEQLLQEQGLKANNINVGAGAPTALLNGDIDILVLSPGPMLPFLEQQQIKALAVTGSARLEKLPEVPTVNEVGLSSLNRVGEYFLMAPAGTPKAVVDKLVSVVNAANKDPEYLQRLSILIGKPGSTDNVDAFNKYIDEQARTWGIVVKNAGISID